MAAPPRICAVAGAGTSVYAGTHCSAYASIDVSSDISAYSGTNANAYTCFAASAGQPYAGTNPSLHQHLRRHRRQRLRRQVNSRSLGLRAKSLGSRIRQRWARYVTLPGFFGSVPPRPVTFGKR